MPQVLLNRASGLRFQGNVLDFLRSAQNYIRIAGRDGELENLINVKPDSLLHGLLEVKNIDGVLYSSSQLRTMSEIAERFGVQFNLVVSPSTTVSTGVQALIARTGGGIYEFDEAARVLTQIFGAPFK